MIGDWPDMSHVKQVMIECELCGHRKPANLGGFTVPVVMAAGDDSRFRWITGTVSIRRWRALSDMRQPVSRAHCPKCGWVPFLASGISEGAAT